MKKEALSEKMDSIDINNLSNENILELLQILSTPNPSPDQLSLSQNILQKFIKIPQSINTFLYHLSSNPNSNIRQLSALMLYKSIEQNFDDLPEEKKDEIKKKVLELYSKEKVNLVLKSIGIAIYKICKKNLLEDKWDYVLDTVFTSPEKYIQGQEKLFEINLHIIADLVGSVNTLLKDKEKISQIKKILSTAFSQGNNQMKEYATECLGYLIQNLDSDYLDIFKDLADFLFKDLKSCDEKVISKVYETLCDCRLDILNFFNDIEEPTKITIELLSKPDLKNNIKSMMAEFINMIAQYKKKIFTKNDCKYLKQLLILSVEFINSEENEQSDNIIEEDSLCLFNIGLAIINLLTRTISSKKTFPFLIEIIKKYINSTRPLERRGAIAIIGEMSEGCAVPMKDNIEDIINLLINTFSNDLNEKVKGQCIIAMDYLSQFCSPEINEYYDKIIPMLLQGIYSKSEDIIEKSLLEINYFFSLIDFEMEDYLNMNSELNIKLLNKIIELIKTTKNGSIQAKALTALGAVVVNGHNLNTDILIPILTSLQIITKTKNTANDQKLIGNTLDCIGNILVVIKKEKFNDELEQYFNKFALECIKSPIYDLQLGGLSYFSALAEIKKENFAPMLNDIMIYVEKIIKDKSGIVEKAKDIEELKDPDSDEEDMEGNDEVYWNQDFMEVKSISLKCLAIFAKSCPKIYLDKFYDFTLEQLDFFSTYINENLFFEVGDLYEAMLISLSEIKSDKEVNDFWINEVLTHYESFINETDDEELVGHIFAKMYNIIQHFGKNIFIDKTKNELNTSLDRIINLTLKLLRTELPCQIKNKDAEEAEYEHEEDIFDSIENICVCLSEKLQDDFHNYFNIIYPELSKYLKPTFDEESRQHAFGIIAEVLRHTKISIKFHCDQLFQDINKNLSGKKKVKDNEKLFRHIAYLIGVLFSGDCEASKKYINQGLQNLQYIFEKTKKEGKDNVIAALCRLIMAYQYNKTNFPLFDKSLETIMNNLPLKYDNNENLTVLDFFIYSIEMLDLTQYEKYLNNIMKTLHCIVIFDSKCETKKEDLDKVKGYLTKLNQNDTIKNSIENIIAKEFTPAEKEKFIKNLS